MGRIPCIDSKNLYSTLEATVEAAVSMVNGGNSQTLFSVLEQPDNDYMISGLLRLDRGERVRLYLPPSENPRQLLAVELLDNNGKAIYSYTTSCLNCTTV